MHFQSLKKELVQKGGFDIERIQKAYIFAEKAHTGQKRKTGEDYVTHPVAVAQKLVHMNADEESIIAALLHDTVEDTSITLEEVEQKFGKDVAYLVDGLTKFEKNTFEGQKELDENIETIRKWMSALEKDLRIAIIKIADRIDNLASLSIFRQEKRMRISRSTLDIYARVAKWLSLEEVRQELECYSFPHILNTEQYEELEKQINETEQKQTHLANKIQTAFDKQNSAKKKSYKFSSHLVSVQEVYFSPNPPLALYCIVPNERECYNALSFLHKQWRQKRGSFRDYINTPKINGYQGLHTSIICEEEQVKIKIMTPEMYDYYLHGVSTFCFDKKKKQKQLPWMEKMKELLQTNKKKSYEFWRGVQSDLLEGFILVYGPKGTSMSLPQTSTYLDAAFGFLKEKALYTSAIISGGKQIPQRRRIVDGAKIEFHTEKTPQVQYDWLQDVDNVRSIRIIKDYLRERKRKEKIESGKILLQEQFDAHDLGMVDELKEQTVLVACQSMEIHSMEELFIKIAEVQILPSEVVARIAPEKTRQKDEKDEKKFSIICEVRKDRFSDFSAIVSKYIIHSKINTCHHNKNLFRIYLECSAPTGQKESLMRDIRRHKGMRISKIYAVKKSNILSWGILIFLSLLWGVGLVAADYLIEYKNIEPMLFSASRLWTITIFMIILLAIESKRKREVSKPINITHWSFYAAAISFMGIPIFTYLALAHATPSQYVLFMITHSVLVLFVTMIEKRVCSLSRILPILALLGTGSYFFILNNPGFTLIGKILILLSVLSFGGYSYASNYYAKKLKVKLRYPQFLAAIASLGAVVSTVIYALFIQHTPSLQDLLYTSAYSIVFPGVAYILYYIFINREGYSSMIGYSFFMFLAVTYFCQIFFLEKTIYVSEWIALPFFVLAVFLGAKYLERINAETKVNISRPLP